MGAIYAAEDSTPCLKAWLSGHSRLQLERRGVGTEPALLRSNGECPGFSQGNRL